jgi:hypothetical protein
VKIPAPFVAAVTALPMILLAGCSWIVPTRRKLPIPKAPDLVQTVTPDDLVEQLNKRWVALEGLTATVEIRATQLKTKEGVAKDFPSCKGFILMRKPGMLRVIGQYFGVRIFDMSSDGGRFTLLMPTKGKVIEGSDATDKKPAHPPDHPAESKDPSFENLRPGFFFDAMVVRGVAADDYYTRMADTETIESSDKKHLYSVPEYVLSITRHNPGSRNDTPVRVITFRREDLLPYQQDLYDENGTLETEVSYAQYTDFGGVKYPSQITIKRPLEGIRLVLSVDRVVENPRLTDDQFQIKLPDGVKIQDLESGH